MFDIFKSFFLIYPILYHTIKLGYLKGGKTLNFIFYALLILVIFVFFLFIIKDGEYKKSSYFKSTKLPLLKVMFDKGKYGEYLTYKYLNKYEKSGCEFLFNAYIPKKDDENTEIDVMMISPQGIFVFESKNYSGWIFGNEKQRMWTQTLPSGRNITKEQFFNPIIQNKTHIKYLRKIVGDDIPIHSIIVFSERCELKKVRVESQDVYVIKRNSLAKCVSMICDKSLKAIMDQSKIDEIYSKLLPLTNVSEEVKKQHIESINQKHHKNTQSDIICAPSPVNNDTEQNQESKEINNDTDSKEDLICPRCSSKLVLRTAKKGENAGKQFYGCSNYPKCRYIMPVDDNVANYTNTTNCTPHNDCDPA